MTLQFWPIDLPINPMLNATGGPIDNLASFDPDAGPPISRPKTTALVELWDVQMIFQPLSQGGTFETWWRDNLAFGSVPFVWRHPRTKAAGMWRIPRQFQQSFPAAEVMRVAFTAMALPGNPWFASYVPEGTARAPFFVADYTGSVYGVDGVKGIASGLAAVTGTYEVWTYLATGTVTIGLITYAGDVPQTAPAGVTKLIGFLP